MPEQLAMDVRMQPLLHRRLQELQLLGPDEENNNKKRFTLPPITPRDSSAESGPSSVVQSSAQGTSSRGSRDNGSRLSRSDRLSPALGRGSREDLLRLSRNDRLSPAFGFARSKTMGANMASQSNPTTPATHRRQLPEPSNKNRRAFSPNPKSGLKALSPDKAEFTNFPKSSPKISRHYKSGLDRSRTSLDVHVVNGEQQHGRPAPRLTRKQQQNLFERLAKGEKREKESVESEGEREIDEPVIEPFYERDVDMKAAIAKCSNWLSEVEEIKQTDCLEPVVSPVIEWDDKSEKNGLSATVANGAKPGNVFHIVYDGPQSTS